MPTLKQLREQALLSQSELAEAIGVHPRSILDWEHGRKLPRPAHRRKLAEALKISPQELLAAMKETKERRKQSTDNERPAA